MSSTTASQVERAHGPSSPPTTPRRSASASRSAVISAAQLMVVLDGTIVNIALPHIQTDLGFSQAQPVVGRHRLHARLRRPAAARRPPR